jgi:hypothetical protein
MNETSLVLLTIILGELFLFSLMIIGTLIIYYHFAQPNEPIIDMDSIEMHDENSLKTLF